MADTDFGIEGEPAPDNGEAGTANDLGAIGASFFGGIGGGTEPGSGGGDSGNNGERFDAAIHVSPDKRNRDGSYTRKRGRRSGGGSGSARSTKADNSASVDALSRMLAVVHIGIAAVIKSPEMVLDETEAKSLAEATANVLTEFDIRPSPKAEAIFGLVVCSSMIYGPRAYLIIERRKEERDKVRNERS